MISLNNFSSDIIEQIENILDESNIEIKKLDKTEDKVLSLDIKYNNKLKIKMSKIITKLSNLESIKCVEEA